MPQLASQPFSRKDRMTSSKRVNEMVSVRRLKARSMLSSVFFRAQCNRDDREGWGWGMEQKRRVHVSLDVNWRIDRKSMLHVSLICTVYGRQKGVSSWVFSGWTLLTEDCRFLELQPAPLPPNSKMCVTPAVVNLVFTPILCCKRMISCWNHRSHHLKKQQYFCLWIFKLSLTKNGQ